MGKHDEGLPGDMGLWTGRMQWCLLFWSVEVLMADLQHQLVSHSFTEYPVTLRQALPQVLTCNGSVCDMEASVTVAPVTVKRHQGVWS